MTIKELFIKNVKNTKELSILIDKYLIPQELEKKTNAEVSTPYSLRQDMLNLIPLEFWKTKKKVFEPCSGKGGFLIDIIDKFMVSLDIKDENEKYKLIVEECLYFSDINTTNIFICKLLLDPYDEYKLNFNVGNTLEIDIFKKWNLEGFDAIIGNPPYNGTLYKKFTEYSLKNTNILLFVVPSTFTIGVSSAKFIETLKNNGLKSIHYISKNEWNVKIDIDTLYLLCIKNYNDKIMINNVINIDRNENIRNIKNNVYFKINEKIKNYLHFELLKGKNKTLNYKSKTDTENIKFKKDDIYKYELLSRLNGGKKEEIYYVKEFLENDISKGVKILMPRGTGSYNSLTNLKKTNKSIVYSRIEEKNVLLSTGIVYINCINLEEATFLQWYLMNSKLIKFMFINENKFSELTKGFVNILPKPDYTKIKNNNDLEIYKFFNFDNDEITMIENSFL
jgi:hypothetical protein